MSADHDLRTKITDEAWCWLSAVARVTGKEITEIARDILHEKALQQIHVASVTHNLLIAQGVKGIVGDSHGRGAS